jgi:ABC-type antimicrobial peptide transport system permease subunit
VVLNLVLHRWEAAIGWRALAAALGGTAALTISAGWIPSWRLLKKKPIEVLREIG